MSFKKSVTSPTTQVGIASKSLGNSPAQGPWIRNPNWPILAFPASNNTIVGLYAVFPNDGVRDNLFAISCTTSTGQYRVDFGDGTTTDYNSAEVASRDYDFTNANLYSDVNLPYKIAIVTITALTGNITAFNFDAVHPQAGLQAIWNRQWLELKVHATGSNITFGTNGQCGLLENIEASINNAFTATRAFGLRRAALTFNTGSNFSLQNAFSGMRTLTDVSINFAGAGLVNNCTTMFQNCQSLTSVRLFNTANVTNMQQMFQSCQALTSVPLFNTANVTNMQQMFQGCTSLTSVPLFNTANVTNMSQMFQNCSALTSVPLFNTANVTNMSQMFQTCPSLTSVPLFNTANVTNMLNIVNNCQSLTSVPLFNTANVTNMSSMFGSCQALTSVPLFNTASVTNMLGMFSSCTALTSVPLFNTANVTNMSTMFQNCQSLQEVPAFNLTGVSSSTNFNNFISNNTRVSRIRATGARFTHTIANNTLSGAALDEYYTGLPTVTTAQTLTVSGNYGTATDTPSIATGKGWTVSGS
jgi:surface protein